MVNELQTLLQDLRTAATEFAATFLQASAPLKWNKTRDDPQLDSMDNLAKPFDREEAGQKYKQALDSADKAYGARDVQSAKMQSDLLASFQQGFQSRYQSRLALIAAAAGRQQAFGENIIQMVERQVSNMESAQ